MSSNPTAEVVAAFDPEVPKLPEKIVLTFEKSDDRWYREQQRDDETDDQLAKRLAAEGYHVRVLTIRTPEPVKVPQDKTVHDAIERLENTGPANRDFPSAHEIWNDGFRAGVISAGGTIHE